MEMGNHAERQPSVAMRVRQNVASAAIGAALLLYFGFRHIAEPTGTELFDYSARLFCDTLRIGGLALAAMAIWSLAGRPTTLAVDAVITFVIGVLFILTGLGMAIDGGRMDQTIINLVCGGLFISSGVRNWRDFRCFGAMSPLNPAKILDSQCHQVDRNPQAFPEIRSPKSPSPAQEKGRDEDRGAQESTTPITPPPEGFLASLAKKSPSTDEEGRPK